MSSSSSAFLRHSARLCLHIPALVAEVSSEDNFEPQAISEMIMNESKDQADETLHSTRKMNFTRKKRRKTSPQTLELQKSLPSPSSFKIDVFDNY